MSFGYKISDSARTRPNTKNVETIQFIETTSNEEDVPVLKKSPILIDADGNTENCFVEIIQSEDIVPDEDVEMGENGQYSIINVDPNITSCSEHPDMYLHKDKTLIKPGDKFDSHESFRLYIDGNADRWKYYYSCADSRAQSSGREYYTYRCVYSKPKCDYKPKGLRRRAETLKTNCPCRIVLKRLSYNSKYLTAVFVCDHHNHELSQESFSKLQHGRRLPPKLKEEIMGLLFLDVDPAVIRNYVRSVTGQVLRKPYFHHMARTLKGINIEKTYTADKLNMLYKKAEELKRTYGRLNDDELEDNPKPKRGKRRSNVEYYEVEQDIEADNNYEIVEEESQAMEVPESPNKKSRLETCLQRISYDNEVLKSVRRLQSSVQCETQDNLWIKQEHFIAANGSFQQIQDESQETTVASLVDADNIVVMEGEDGGPQHYILQKTDDTASGEFTAYPCEVLYEQDPSELEVQDPSVLEVQDPSVLEVQDPSVLGVQDPSELEVQDPSIHGVQDPSVHGVQDPSVVEEHDASVIEDQFHSIEEQGHSVVEEQVVSNEELVAHEEQAQEVPIVYEPRHDDVTTPRTKADKDDHEPYNFRSGPPPDYDYIHRYNIDHYMKQTWFPKYIEKVAVDSRASIAEMLCDLYWGKSMFRLVTTVGRGSKTIRISYLCENVPTLDVIEEKETREYRYQASKHCRRVMSLKKKLADTSNIVRHLNEILLKAKRENKELAYKNKLLENTRSQGISIPRMNKDREITEAQLNNYHVQKKALQTQIRDAENQIRQLEEIKRNLKRDICKFVSKKVLLKRISGEQVDKLEEVKSTLARAIRNSSYEDGNASNVQ